jgi:hypothetical protein
MNILKSLLAEFAPVAAPLVERDSHPVLTPNSHLCPHCQGIDHWQPYGSDAWYCTSCDPPPSESMVANRHGAPKIISSVAYAVGHHAMHSMSFGGNRIEFPAFETRPICQCGSHMITEHTWSDGLATYECACDGPACKLLPTKLLPTAQAPTA